MTILEAAKAISVWPKMTHIAELKQSLSSQMLLIEDDDGGLAWIDSKAKEDFIKTASCAPTTCKRQSSNIKKTKNKKSNASLRANKRRKEKIWETL